MDDSGIVNLLRDSIRRYYRSHWIEAPPRVEQREFGVGEYGKKITVRHMSFPDERSMNRYLRERSPFYISYSVGYFKYPENRPMENKILLGSDLVFEFDVDELGIRSEKDVWVCDNCGSYGFGWRDRCPKCGSPVRVEIFPDEEREEKLKEMVDSLIKDFLLDDLGLSEKEVSVNFSGNRGYHIHVRSESFYSLDKEARIEIVEYITGQSIDPNYLFGRIVLRERDPMQYIEGPSPASRGWPGRVARSVIEVLKKGDEDILRKSGLNSDQIKAVLANKDLYISSISRGLWPTPALFPLSVWVSVARLTAPTRGHVIDTNTSVDIHRLIRLPDSIHGTTGLIAKRVSNLKSFDPYRDAVALPSKEVTVRVKVSPQFEMKGKTFGPYEEEELQLPLYVAFYLIGRGVAEWALTSER